jgi:hypothetical protein
MVAETTVKVDGKIIKASEMPKNCYLINGEWYTEKGLPEKLLAYKQLWENDKVSATDAKKKLKSQVTQTPSSEPSPVAPTAK